MPGALSTLAPALTAGGNHDNQSLTRLTHAEVARKLHTESLLAICLPPNIVKQMIPSENKIFIFNVFDVQN